MRLITVADRNSFHDIDRKQLVFNESEAYLIGSGSIGDVYRCTYRGKLVALKKIKTRDISPDVVNSIRREATIMSLTRDRNIIGFEGYDGLENQLITELGHCNLNELLHDPLKRPLPTRVNIDFTVKLGLVKDIISGLMYLHFRNIVHKDLKPSNVLICCESYNGMRLVAKICDFGISSFASSTSQTPTMIGTTAYMAPELLFTPSPQKKKINKYKCDIFSFGILMNEVFSNSLPWPGWHSAHIIGMVLKGERPVRYRSSNKGDEVIMTLIGDRNRGCLAQDSNKRATALDLYKQLHMEDDPVAPNYSFVSR